ncbi:helix-turn-helix domain-containing protein [Streptomyces acidiscabies]|uniref:DNA-binding protein n=1 Tax=Streptomyces acidiscabies TaxID=42234 RepID=A0A0L0K0Y7_9ACTN|nr:helix-turn-helix transcriptional regulator [Streptomyces acidiscabies]KND31496.1 DNA-binding protein [Streptomyces acidiscabies]
MARRRPVTGMSQEPRERFRQVIKEHREKRKLSFRELAKRLGWDQSLLSRLESGATIGSPQVAIGLDTFYGTTPLILTLWELAAADPEQYKAQYRPYMKYEAQAIALWHYGDGVLHGLLQTREYARELLMMGGYRDAELEQQVESRMNRRAVLEGEGAPDFRAILSEAVLRNVLRDPQEWRRQLEYLLEVMEYPNVTLYVLPFGVGLHGLPDTAVTFLKLPDGRVVANMENAVRSELIEDANGVAELQRRYDAIRDMAKNPAESRSFILRLLEEVPCDPST